MSKPTIASVVKEVSKNKPTNTTQMHKEIKRRYPEMDVSIKDLSNFLYREYYDEDYERCISIKNFY